VVKSESQDAPGYTVDFLVSLGANKTAFVEVKSPGWEGHDLTDAERRAGRAKQAKYSESIHGRFSRPIDIIRTTVQKWWVKFSGKAPSILIISDDCFIHLGAFGYGPLQMALLPKSIAYGDGLFQDPEYSNIGVVFLFWWILDLQRCLLVSPRVAPTRTVRLSLRRVGNAPNQWAECGVATSRAAITASVNSWVVALPPRSRVACLPSL
jgi:hypothetical protein